MQSGRFLEWMEDAGEWKQHNKLDGLDVYEEEEGCKLLREKMRGFYSHFYIYLSPY